MPTSLGSRLSLSRWTRAGEEGLWGRRLRQTSRCRISRAGPGRRGRVSRRDSQLLTRLSGRGLSALRTGRGGSGVSSVESLGNGVPQPPLSRLCLVFPCHRVRTPGAVLCKHVGLHAATDRGSGLQVRPGGRLVDHINASGQIISSFLLTCMQDVGKMDRGKNGSVGRNSIQ